MEINEKDVLRYLGYQNHQADIATLEYIEQIKTELQTCIKPKYVYGKWKCTVDTAGTPAGIVKIENIVFSSKNLASHIRDCEWVILLAVTLGTEADTIIRRYCVIDAAKAAVAQAVCTAMLESFCDSLECHIASEESGEGVFLKSRFSPGYGDFNIIHQKDILKLLEYKKRTGITLTDKFMMIPAKSITAIIGLTKEKQTIKRKCESCTNLQCDFREEHINEF